MHAPALPEPIEKIWRDSIIPELIEYIRIPNKSPHFDADWQRNGHMDRVVERFTNWARGAGIANIAIEVQRLPGRTPLIFIEIPGASEQTVLLYGHLDKQPEMSGWRAPLGPWQPHIEDERLYGRGGADDGYAMFASLAAIKHLQDHDRAHSRCVVIIEACEESGSYDLPHYVAALRQRIGKPDLVVCLDSGCGNYAQLWCTTSLRGLVSGDLRIGMLREGVHSGDASGIVASSFRVLRECLARIEDASTGEILLGSLHVEIPEQRKRQAAQAARVLGEGTYDRFPFCTGAAPVSHDAVELILNRTWRPALEITGAEGLPSFAESGNVLRPQTCVRLSMRLPPSCDAVKAAAALKTTLEANPPYGATVEFERGWCASGWEAPPLHDWLENSLDVSSRRHFGLPAVQMGEGGTIPFMGMLGEEFPEAQFVITGVLGPQSNAHGPNEFLHIPTAQRLTCCIADVLEAHHLQHR